MSADLEWFLRQPGELMWDPDKRDDLRQHYRELDAPLTRYLLGIGRLATGQAALPVDWDWGKSWTANQADGALPSPELLYIGRLTLTMLLPLTLLFIYLFGRAVGGRLSGLLAVLLMSLNALSLLHLRRAMAEGALLFGISFALWSFLDADRRPWLAGLAVGLAIGAKQSALALLPVGFLAILWTASPRTISRRILGVVVYSAVFLFVTLVLNPFLWSHPIKAAQAALSARQDLMQKQVANASRLNPELVLDTPARRIFGLTAHLFFTPPAFAEVQNYVEDTALAEHAYLARPYHSLGRGLLSGGIFLNLFLFGLVVIMVQLRKAVHYQRRALLILLAATTLQGFSIVAFFILPWQRYVIPLLPLVCLIAAAGLIMPFRQKNEMHRRSMS